VVVGWLVGASGPRSWIVALPGPVRSRVRIRVTGPLARVGYRPSSIGGIAKLRRQVSRPKPD
jgi:hypothetical protein